MSGPTPGDLLLERGEELTRIESALAEARTAGAPSSWSRGRPASARRRCSRAARSAASQGGMRVLRRGEPSSSATSPSASCVSCSSRCSPRHREDERADLLQADAGVAAGLLGLPGAPPAWTARPRRRVDPSFAILHGLYWLCANLAAVEPLCLVVDDAHWADAPSLRFLAFLLTRLEELDVALIVATRPREDGTDAGLLATVTSRSVRRRDPSSAADESGGRPARGVDGSAGFRIRSSSTPASARRRARRSSCASSWRR